MAASLQSPGPPLRLDWNDLRFFHAVLEHGSTARAAKATGVDQTTCARRITALETALGMTLFVRDAAGYHPTPAAQVLQPAAAAVAEQVALFARQVETAGRRGLQRLRLTSDEYLTRVMIVPALARFARDYPDVRVDVDSSSLLRDLVAGEADIAVRAGPTPEAPGLVRRKLRGEGWGVYCTDAYAERHGAPTGLEDLAQHALVLPEVAMEGARALGVAHLVRQVLSPMSAALAAVQTGTCVSALPVIVAEQDPALRLCIPLPDAQGAVWLIYPERLREVPELRALAAAIVEAFRKPAA